MKNTLLLFLCMLIAGFSAQAQILEWEQRADFPGDGRSAAIGFGFMDKGFIGTGYDGEDYRRSFYMYDPALDFWTQTESLGGISGEGMERNCAAAFTIGNKGFVATGQGGDPFLNDLWEYNKTANTWTPKGTVGGIDRRCAVGFSIDNKGYVALGQDATGYRKDLWQFDTTTGAWTQKADFIGTPRRLSCGFVIDGKVYIGTGDDGAFTNDFYKYDPVSNTWTIKANFGGSPRYGATAFALNGKGYVACGYDTTFTNQTDFYTYDPLSDVWTQLADFPGGPRTNATAFVVDTLAFLGMGYDTSFLYDIWMFGDTTDPKPIDTSDAIAQWNDPWLDLQLYPNPAVYFISAWLPDPEQQDAQINVYDMRGRDVTEFCQTSIQSGKLQCNVTQLPVGTYQLVVTDTLSRSVGTFVVIH